MCARTLSTSVKYLMTGRVTNWPLCSLGRIELIPTACSPSLALGVLMSSAVCTELMQTVYHPVLASTCLFLSCENLKVENILKCTSDRACQIMKCLLF